MGWWPANSGTGANSQFETFERALVSTISSFDFPLLTGWVKSVGQISKPRSCNECCGFTCNGQKSLFFTLGKRLFFPLYVKLCFKSREKILNSNFAGFLQSLVHTTVGKVKTNILCTKLHLQIKNCILQWHSIRIISQRSCTLVRYCPHTLSRQNIYNNSLSSLVK